MQKFGLKMRTQNIKSVSPLPSAIISLNKLNPKGAPLLDLKLPAFGPNSREG